MEALKKYYLEKIKLIDKTIDEIDQTTSKLLEGNFRSIDNIKKLENSVNKVIILNNEKRIYEKFIKQLEKVTPQRPQLYYVLEGAIFTDLNGDEIFTVVKSGNIIAIDSGTITEVCYLSKVQGFLFLKVPFHYLGKGLLDQPQCLIEAL